MLISLKEGDYGGTKVIVSCPSVGNVSQLAVDLIISSTDCVRVGSVWDAALLPFVGPHPFDGSGGGLCTSCDLFFDADKKLLLVHLRAPVASEGRARFLRELSRRLKSLGVSEVVVLAGIFSVGHHDEDVKYGSFRYVRCPLSHAANSNSFDSLKWIAMKDNKEQNGFACPPLSGSGFARRLFGVCVEDSISCTVLLYFCLEGDNVADSTTFLKKVNEWLGIFADPEKDIRFPSSWKYLFGNSVPDMMY